MMTTERVTVGFVIEQLTEYYEQLIEDDPEAVEFDPVIITQDLINEMNGEIDGFDVSVGSASSYVPQTIWTVLAEEELVDEDKEEHFIKWFEENNS